MNDQRFAPEQKQYSRERIVRLINANSDVEKFSDDDPRLTDAVCQEFVDLLEDAGLLEVFYSSQADRIQERKVLINQYIRCL